jgi:hypothetical protein
MMVHLDSLYLVVVGLVGEAAEEFARLADESLLLGSDAGHLITDLCKLGKSLLSGLLGLLCTHLSVNSDSTRCRRCGDSLSRCLARYG